MVDVDVQDLFKAIKATTGMLKFEVLLFLYIRYANFDAIKHSCLACLQIHLERMYGQVVDNFLLTNFYKEAKKRYNADGEDNDHYYMNIIYKEDFRDMLRWSDCLHTWLYIGHIVKMFTLHDAAFSRALFYKKASYDGVNVNLDFIDVSVTLPVASGAHDVLYGAEETHISTRQSYDKANDLPLLPSLPLDRPEPEYVKNPSLIYFEDTTAVLAEAEAAYRRKYPGDRTGRERYGSGGTDPFFTERYEIKYGIMSKFHEWSRYQYYRDQNNGSEPKSNDDVDDISQRYWYYTFRSLTDVTFFHVLQFKEALDTVSAKPQAELNAYLERAWCQLAGAIAKRLKYRDLPSMVDGYLKNGPDARLSILNTTTSMKNHLLKQEQKQRDYPNIDIAIRSEMFVLACCLDRESVRRLIGACNRLIQIIGHDTMKAMAARAHYTIEQRTEFVMHGIRRIFSSLTEEEKLRFRTFRVKPNPEVDLQALKPLLKDFTTPPDMKYDIMYDLDLRPYDFNDVLQDKERRDLYRFPKYPYFSFWDRTMFMNVTAVLERLG